MRVSNRRAWVWAGGAAGLVVALLAGYLALVGESAGPEGLLALAALGSAIAAVIVYRFTCRHFHGLLEEVGSGLTRARESPSGNVVLDGLKAEGQDILDLVAGPLGALGQSYRQVLSDRVAQEEALEALRALLGRADVDRGPVRAVIRGSGSSRNMVARLTPNLHWMTATPALQQYLGRPLTELNARPFADVVHPADVAGLVRALHEALETGEVHNVGFRVLAREQSAGSPVSPVELTVVEHHVEMDVMTHYADGGRPLHLRCFFVDITDRVKAEEAVRRRTSELEAANERLRRINADLERLKESYSDLYHNAPGMYFSLDAAGRFLACNGTMLQVLGYAREDLLRQPYTRLLSSEARGRFLQEPGAFQQATETETHWVKKDGTVIDVWIRSTVFQDGEGRFVRSRSVAQDVTERNRLANALRRQKEELERTNADLRRTNSELDEFTSVVSHDLKEPLRTLQTYSNCLAEDYAGRLGPDGGAYLSHLVQASRRLGNLIDDLLSLSLAGRVLRVPEAFDLTRTAQTVCRDLADLIRRKGATVHIAGPLPAVLGDEPRVAQLLANLVGNGLKYNTSSCPRVVIGEVAGPPPPVARPAARGKPEAPGLVTLFVRDNGIGIDAPYHEQIFGVFRRLHAEQEYEGTGAGLAICKKVVEAHGGRIWVESAPGQGATFFFTLPRSPVAPADAAASAAQELPGARILLVEDMQEIGLVAQHLGRRAGHHVAWVTSAEAAWDYLRGPDRRPDLLLLDIHLPGMSGVELCRRLRATPELAGLTVALFSQVDRPEALAAARDAGANFVLSKDLLSRPVGWQRRLQAILAAVVRGRPAVVRKDEPAVAESLEASRS
jgi:PAS domain S-box-containing protein